MIDLGALGIAINVNDGDASQKLENFSIKAKMAELKSIGLKSALGKLAGAFAIGVAIKKSIDGLIACTKNADELHKSLNNLQIQTGMTDEEMANMGETVKNIYAKNLGESYEDVANALGEVRTQTGLTGEALESTTQNALLLRDTMDMEVNESIRSADMLMEQFGITSDEAYNLIAQGSQEGLNKNGDLLDVINEYSVHFEQLGFSADEMFNILANGAETGVFSVDKLGDAMKEFGIRAKDGSDTTADAFTALSLDSAELTEKFAKGGEGAEEAFKQVNKALADTDDEVLQNQIGVALYGTMWEDLGADAVLAMSNTQGEISKTNEAMQTLNTLNFDDMGSAFEGIKRMWEVSFMEPLGEHILPLLQTLATWIAEHSEEIRVTIETVSNVIGTIFTGLGEVIKAFVTNAQTEGTYLNGVMNEIKIIFETVFKAIQDIFAIFTDVFNGDWESAWEGVKTLFSDIWDGMKLLFQNNLDTIVGVLDGMKETFKKTAKALMNKLWDGFKNVFKSIITWIDEKITGFIETINGFSQTMYDAGMNLMQNVWDGLKDVWLNVTDWISDRAEDIKNALMFWKDKAEDTKKAKREAESGSDGSHRTGLGYIPFDGYKSILHRGEMVLTQPEADRYRKNESQNSSKGDFIINIEKVENSNGRSTKDFLAEAEFYRKSRQVAVGGE